MPARTLIVLKPQRLVEVPVPVGACPVRSTSNLPILIPKDKTMQTTLTVDIGYNPDLTWNAASNAYCVSRQRQHSGSRRRLHLCGRSLAGGLVGSGNRWRGSSVCLRCVFRLVFRCWFRCRRVLAEEAGLALDRTDGFQPFAEMTLPAAARLRLTAERLGA